MLKAGDNAPDFSLPDQMGEMRHLSAYRGQPVLVYFYPKDDTPGCTKEACAIRDTFPDFKKLGVAVLGISADSVSSHKKFEEKYGLPFLLLSDETRDVIGRYGALQEKMMFGKKTTGIQRMSFLIDQGGRIMKVYENVKPESHAGEVLKDLENII